MFGDVMDMMGKLRDPDASGQQKIEETKKRLNTILIDKAAMIC